MDQAPDVVVTCWGCTRLILVPRWEGGQPAEVFKCGWCEAVNDLKHQQPLAAAAAAAQPAPTPPVWQTDASNQYQQQQTFDYYSHQQHQWQQQQQHWQPPAVWQPGHVTFPAGSSITTGARRRRAKTCWSAALALWRWVVVGLVLVLVGSIAGCGILTLLPLICTTWPTYLPNVAFALLLLFEIMWNYSIAVLRPAGRVSDFVALPPRTPEGFVPQGGLQHWSWCPHCQAPKPPHAHHCKSCGTCIFGMDHHCPFIANCVGHGNLRPFLLVLLYALVAAAYILCMCSLLVSQQWDEVKVSVGAARSRQADPHSSMQQQQVWVLNKSAGHAATDTGSSTEPVSSSRPDMWLLATTGIMVWVLQSSPWWMLAAYYLIAVSLALLVAVGALLGSQLHYLGLGVSYIEHLKASSSPAAAAAAQQGADAQVEGRCRQLRVIWARWWDVMGAGPGGHSKAWALLRPGWGVPVGAGSKKVM